MERTSRHRGRVLSAGDAYPGRLTDGRGSDDPLSRDVTLRLAGTPPLAGVPENDAAMAALRDACRLLDHLKQERDQAEERLAAQGRRDPVKVVTGRSAFDRACQETEELIRRMDELLSEEAERLLSAARGGA